MTTKKVMKNLESIEKIVIAEAPISFAKVCLGCGLSPSTLYSYIPLIKEQYPWIKVGDKKFHFDMFVYTENKNINIENEPKSLSEALRQKE